MTLPAFREEGGECARPAGGFTWFRVNPCSCQARGYLRYCTTVSPGDARCCVVSEAQVPRGEQVGRWVPSRLRP